MTTKKEKSEEKTAGAFYILNFYNQIQQLNQLIASYKILRNYIDKSDDDPEKVPEEYKEGASERSQQTLYQINIVYISYKAISEEIGQEEEKITELYRKLDKQFLLNRDDLMEFSHKINSFLLSNVVKKLLYSSQEFIDSIYQDDDKPSTE